MGFRTLKTEGTPKSLHEEPNPPRAISVVQLSPGQLRAHASPALCTVVGTGETGVPEGALTDQ